jgi:hypothetical protein
MLRRVGDDYGMTTKASSHLMINGVPVVVVSRNKMTSPIVQGYRDCIEEFVIRGDCDGPSESMSKCHQ